MLASILLGFLGGLGGGEIFIILVILLLFFGAKRIPELAKGLGKGHQGVQRRQERLRLQRDASKTAHLLRRMRSISMNEALPGRAQHW